MLHYAITPTASFKRVSAAVANSTAERKNAMIASPRTATADFETVKNPTIETIISPLQKARSGVEASVLDWASLVTSMASLIGVVALYFKKPFAQVESKIEAKLALIAEQLQKSLPAKPDPTKKPKNTILERLTETGEVLKDLYEKFETLDEKVDTILSEMDYSKRLNTEKDRTAGGKQGGEEGFIPACMEKNRKNAEKVATQLKEIKERLSQAEELSKNSGFSSEATQWTPLVQLVEGLTENQRKNPAVAMLVLAEADKVFARKVTALSQNIEASLADEKLESLELLLYHSQQMRVLNKVLARYADPEITLTPEEQQIASESDSLAAHFTQAIEQCAENNFSLAVETPPMLDALYDVLNILHKDDLQEKPQS